MTSKRQLFRLVRDVMTVKLIFSFDSEDFQTPASADAEKWWAETMTRHGIKACVCVVGELARTLRARGRQDVIQALAQHEIAYHSDRHSVHPIWAEYLSECGWDDGVERVMREEAQGIQDVRDIFGQHPSAWCVPGSSWGAQVAYAMTLMHIPFFCGAPFEAAPGRPLWFDNTLLLNYHIAFDRFFGVPHKERLTKMKESFLALCEKHNGGYLVMYTHPCRLVTAKAHDRVFFAGKKPPRAKWLPAPLWPKKMIAELQADFDAFLDFVVKQPNIEFTSYRQIYSDYRPSAEIWLAIDDIWKLCNTIGEKLDYLKLRNGYISPSEQFGVILWTLDYFDEHKKMPEAIPVRRLLGPKEAPPENIKSGGVSISAFLNACRIISQECIQSNAVPARIVLGQSIIGPNAFLQAGLRILSELRQNTNLSKAMPVHPVSEYPAIIEREDFRTYTIKDWPVFSPDFDESNVLQTIRLQAWTAKPACPRNRG